MARPFKKNDTDMFLAGNGRVIRKYIGRMDVQDGKYPEVHRRSIFARIAERFRKN